MIARTPHLWIPKQITDSSELEEDKGFASKKAQAFMEALFGGEMPVRCTCGQPVKYKDTGLRCECGAKLGRVEYTDDYNRWLIKTIINVDKKTFELWQLDPDTEIETGKRLIV